MANDRLEFRKLKKEEIECRVQSVKSTGCILLLYKDARCDMKILDEVVGAYNWKREHIRNNANCIVSIWDYEKKQWISKEDTGVESNTEKEKGLASDSFKRACFNWGIGRELYTSPFIWLAKDTVKISTGNNNKNVCYDKFKVENIAYDGNGKISELDIINLSTKKIVFMMTSQEKELKNIKPKNSSKMQEARKELSSLINKFKLDKNELTTKYNLDGKSTADDVKKVIERIKKEGTNE